MSRQPLYSGSSLAPKRGRALLPVLVFACALALLLAVLYLFIRDTRPVQELKPLALELENRVASMARQAFSAPNQTASEAAASAPAQDEARADANPQNPVSRHDNIEARHKPEHFQRLLLDGAEPPPPAPDLNRSDSPLRSSLLALDITGLLAERLVDEELIRRFVVSVENLAQRRIPRKHRLLQPPASEFAVQEEGDTYLLTAANYPRYNHYITLLNLLDTQELLALYRQYYPLMQKAYAQLGFPRRSFHERLLQALDQVLALEPEERAPLALEAAPPFYRYADPKLEGRSDLYQQLVRLGPAHTQQLQARLQALRQQLGRLHH